MGILKKIPYLGFILIAYNILIIASGSSAVDELGATVFSARLISGAQLTLTVGHLFIIFGLVALFLEIVAAVKSSLDTVVDHAVSMIVFVIFLIQFIVMAKAGTATFLILTIMALLDVIAGFTVSLSTARRDINLGD